MQSPRHFRVKEVAEISGLSVRALHHYDALGLLTPSLRSSAGYRLYSDSDLLRLQQILVGRELGFSLEEIRRSLDDPSFDTRRALLQQRAALAQRARRTDEMIRALDAALALVAAPDDDKPEDTTMDMKKIFDGFDPAAHEPEAKQRWGNTEAYKVSAQRTKGYTKEDWQRYRVEQDSIYADALAALKSGKAPTDVESMDVAERHRLSIDRWFYPSSVAMHCGLANLYEADQRFQENIDKHGAGLTAFLSAATRANAQRSDR